MPNGFKTYWAVSTYQNRSQVYLEIVYNRYEYFQVHLWPTAFIIKTVLINLSCMFKYTEMQVQVYTPQKDNGQ